MRAPATRRSRPLRLAFRAWLLVVLAAVTSSWTLAWVAPCGAHEAATSAAETKTDDCCPKKAAAAPDAQTIADGDDGDPDGDCSCPVGCGPCCAGMPPSAVMTVPGVAPALLPAYTLLTFASIPDAHPDGTASDILHVPRS